MKAVAATVFAVLLLLSCSFASFPVKGESQVLIVPDQFSTVEEAVYAAMDGDTIFIKEGIYDGEVNQTLVINKTITLTGQCAESTILNLKPSLVEKNIFTFYYMGYADPISIQASNVQIDGLTINSPGGNIAVAADSAEFTGNIISVGIVAFGNGTQIVHNSISGAVYITGSCYLLANNSIVGTVQSKGQFNTIAGNHVSGATNLYAIDVYDNNSRIMNNTIIGKDGWPGIHLNYAATNNTVAKNNLHSSGLQLDTRCTLNVVYGNNLNGYGLSLMGFNNTFYANQLSRVYIGGTHGGTVDAAYNRFYHNNFNAANPEFRVYTKDPGPIFFDNDLEGNYWSSNNLTGEAYQVFGEYHYFDGSIREDTTVPCGVDPFPLAVSFDIKGATSDWTLGALGTSPQPTQASAETNVPSTSGATLSSRASTPTATVPSVDEVPLRFVGVILVAGLAITAAFVLMQSKKLRR